MICLNMIVKDEEAVIERLLGSVIPFISSYLIVDTGSTDDTPEIIRRFMRAHSISGEVVSRPWVNFGHNRQEALDLAISTINPQWLLFIDADEELKSTSPNWHLNLERGKSYRIEKEHGSLRYSLTNLVWLDGYKWRWQGAVHEYVYAEPEAVFGSPLNDVWIHSYVSEGARSRGISEKEKFIKDALLLEASIQSDASNARDRFYLAQSYRDADELELAYEHYGIRANMLGWDEETYMAQYERACLAIRMGMDHSMITQEFLRAYSLRPSRSEPLWRLASYCREQERYAEGYLYAKVGKDIPMPNDILFIQHDVYAWRLLDEFSVCAYWIGQYKEALDACREIHFSNVFPETEKTRLAANLSFALEKCHGSANG
jgi:glycosyltransferase involved in cell wall biosynthesis